MKTYHCKQRTAEWFDVKRGIISATDADSFCLNPLVVKLTIPQICEELTKLSIDHKKNAKREDLLKLLPSLDPHKVLSEAAQKLILKKIREGSSGARDMRDAWELEESAQKEKKLSYSIPIQRGNALESEAHEFYVTRTGFRVSEVGFVEHDIGGFGCSPDGLILNDDDKPMHGLEIKCPMPETHLAYLLAGTLPEDYKFQVHASMAVTGLNRWDFLSYCPGEAALLLTVERDDFTDQLESGLKEMVAQKAIIKSKLADLWRSQKAREPQPVEEIV